LALLTNYPKIVVSLVGVLMVSWLVILIVNWTPCLLGENLNTLTASAILGLKWRPLLNPKPNFQKTKCICSLTKLFYFHSPGGSICTISLRRGRQG